MDNLASMPVGGRRRQAWPEKVGRHSFNKRERLETAILERVREPKAPIPRNSPRRSTLGQRTVRDSGSGLTNQERRDAGSEVKVRLGRLTFGEEKVERVALPGLDPELFSGDVE